MGASSVWLLCCWAVASAAVVRLVGARPVTMCPPDGDDQVALRASNQDLLVSLMGALPTNQQVMACELRPGATLRRSIVFQGSDRWWFEVSLPPVTLLEVVCTVHDFASQQLLRSPTVVCARCHGQHGDVGANDTVGSGDSDAEGSPALPHLPEDVHDIAGLLPQSRRLRRSADSHTPALRRQSKQATVAVAMVGLVAAVFLAVLCGSKSKDKTSTATEQQDGTGSRPNGSGVSATEMAESTGSTDGAPADDQPCQEAAEPVSGDAESRDAAAAAAVPVTTDASTDAEAIEGSVPSTSPHRVASDTNNAAAENATDAESLPSERAASPPYASVTRPEDHSIEESGNGVVVGDSEENQNKDGYAYARVQSLAPKSSKDSPSSRKDGAPNACKNDDDDDDDPSYEEVIAAPPPGKCAAADADRSPSHSRTVGTDGERHGSKASPHGRSLPDPVGAPAFLVPPAKLKIRSASESMDEEDDDHTYSSVDEAKRQSKRISDPYAHVDDDFRSKMKTISGGDSPYARAFDDISEVAVEEPYSSVQGAGDGGGGAGSRLVSPALSKQGSLQDDQLGDNPYDNVFDRGKSRLKSPAGEGEHLYAKPGKPDVLPEEAESPPPAPADTAGKLDEIEIVDGQVVTIEALYALPTKTKGQASDEASNVETERIYEEPPELAPKGPGAGVLESTVQHYEAGKEDEPVAGLPVNVQGAVYAMPGKGKLTRETAPELGERTEESKELVPAGAPKEKLDGGGYSQVTGEELEEARRKLDKKTSLSSVDSRGAAEEADDDDHLYSAVLDNDLDGARRRLSSSSASPPTNAKSSTLPAGRPKRHHGYSKVSGDMLAAPKDADEANGDPGYMEVDAALKEKLAQIRQEAGNSPALAAPRNVSRSRAQTTRTGDSLPPEPPRSQRPRASTMDALRSSNEQDLLKHRV